VITDGNTDEGSYPGVEKQGDGDVRWQGWLMQKQDTQFAILTLTILLSSGERQAVPLVLSVYCLVVDALSVTHLLSTFFFPKDRKKHSQVIYLDENKKKGESRG